jgi:uncharacterized protein
MQFDGFDWDEGNTAKCQKHGLSRREIEALFLSGPRVAPDVMHSESEQRFLAIGQYDSTQRPVFVVFTFREKLGGLLVRPISARYMHTKEIKSYER